MKPDRVRRSEDRKTMKQQETGAREASMLQAGIYRQESTAWTPVSVIPYEVPSRTATASLGEPKQREGPAPRVCGSRILVANVDGKIVATPDGSGADSLASRALRVKD